MPAELITKHETEFARYYELYEAYNSHTNISAIRDKEGVYTKHFADSLMALPFIEDYLKTREPINILDIGTGGGFPAIPLAIVLKDRPVHIVALDSVGKKTKFVESVKQELNLDQVEVIKSRAEDIKKTFDIVVSRAVAMLPETIVYVAPLLRAGGLYIAYKKQDIDDEIQSAKGIVKRSKMELLQQFSYDSKQLLIYKKY